MIKQERVGLLRRLTVYDRATAYAFANRDDRTASVEVHTRPAFVEVDGITVWRKMLKESAWLNVAGYVTGVLTTLDNQDLE